MTAPTPTVRLEAMRRPDAIRMVWERAISGRDVRDVFNALLLVLNAAPNPIYVIVDIQSDPQFPLKNMFSSALWQAHRHPNLVEWLVVGSNSLAHAIDRTLSKVTRRDNIRWFDSEADALAHIDSARVAERV